MKPALLIRALAWALALATPIAPAVADAAGIDWIEDDFQKARELAKKKKKPIVVDLWAKWCHTCLSMKAHVFTDAQIEAYAKKFVWLSLDTDKLENARALKLMPVDAWPTIYVFSPVDDSIQGRMVGAATPEQLIGLFEQGLEGHKGVLARKDGFKKAPHMAQWREADTLMAEGEPGLAAFRYGKAYHLSPRGWARRQELVSAWALALYQADKFDKCLKIGGSHLVPATKAVAASAADFIQTVNGCADGLIRTGKGGELEAEISRFRRRAVVALKGLLDRKDGHLTVDDRADAMRILRELYLDLDRQDEAKAIAEAQLKLLDEAALAAPDQKARAMYNWPRSEVYLFLGRGPDLVDQLRYSAQQLPNEYDPIYRLAWMLHKLGRDQEAVEPAQQAANMTYGPRKARALTLLGDIHEALGNLTETRRARMGAVAMLEGLPQSQRSPKAIEAARQALARLPKAADK